MRSISDHGPGLTVGLTVVLVHVLVNFISVYELHRDAFLYLAMGEHLRLWGMDFPPFIALLARSTRWLLGDAIPAIRVGPALAHGAVVFLGAAFARELGARRGTQALAALVVATGAVFLRAGSLFQPVVFDQLWWTLALFALLKIGRFTDEDWRRRRRWWWVFGVVMGLALLTKLTALVLGLAVLLGLLLSPQRRELASRQPWMAAAVAFALGSPSIVGQIRLGFPILGQMDVLRASQLARVSPLDFVMGQALQVGPFILVAWLGMGALLIRKDLRARRVVGWSALGAFLMMMAMSAKAYYIAPIYPGLIGVGLAVVDRWARNRKTVVFTRGRLPGFGVGTVVQAALWGMAVVWGIVGFPMGVPVLPPPSMARYAAGLGLTEAVRTNRGIILPLPQDYADMLGWERLVDGVARVYHALPSEERSRAVILCSNYGEAGAVDFYGPDRDLPSAVAFVGSYWYWGPGDLPGEVVLAVGYEDGDLDPYFRSVELAAVVENPWGVPEQQAVRIEIARDPLRTLQEMWPEWEGQH